ncbi:hypothetical protein ACS0TY_029643 [Phlomoides rotata]
MAPSTLLIFLFSLFFLSSFSNATIPLKPKPQTFIFPIKKDNTTNQYYTSVQFGLNRTTFNVVIDLGGKFLWFNSPDYFDPSDYDPFQHHYPTTSWRPIECGSLNCRIANGAGCVYCYELRRPVAVCPNTCADYAFNPFVGTWEFTGLGQDALRVYSTSGNQYRVTAFSFLFSESFLREGLASPTVGLIGLGRTRISLQAQLASTFKIPQKFTLCIPSSGSNGNLIIGSGVYKRPFKEISESLFTSALVRNPVSTFGNEQIGNLSVEYFINVKSVRVGGKALTFDKTLLSIDKKTGGGGTSIRTVRAYTSLHRSIYTALINEFVKAAVAKNIKRVASVAPFGACFDSKTITNSKTGPRVPSVDLVLQSKDVYWRFYGSNSMVRVRNNVMCLAFVEEKLNLTGPTTSIVVGGYQMENHLLEFDEASSRLGFSSSLLLHGTSCSQFGAA